MTQETFEQMFKRIAEETDDGTGEQMFVDTDGWLDAIATRLREELAKNQKPIGWLYTDAYGTHYTDDKREWYDAVGIEEVTPLYTRHFVDTPTNAGSQFANHEPDAVMKG